MHMQSGGGDAPSNPAHAPDIWLSHLVPGPIVEWEAGPVDQEAGPLGPGLTVELGIQISRHFISGKGDCKSVILHN